MKLRFLNLPVIPEKETWMRAWEENVVRDHVQESLFDTIRAIGFRFVPMPFSSVGTASCYISHVALTGLTFSFEYDRRTFTIKNLIIPSGNFLPYVLKAKEEGMTRAHFILFLIQNIMQRVDEIYARIMQMISEIPPINQTPEPYNGQ